MQNSMEVNNRIPSCVSSEAQRIAKEEGITDDADYKKLVCYLLKEYVTKEVQPYTDQKLKIYILAKTRASVVDGQLVCDVMLTEEQKQAIEILDQSIADICDRYSSITI